jgi:hypothetical protein
MFVRSMITPRWWSEEAFDLVGAKAGHELQQQPVVQPSARSLVADLRIIIHTLRYDIADKPYTSIAASDSRFLRPDER